MYKLKNLHEKVFNGIIRFNKALNDEIQLSDQEIEALLKKQQYVLDTYGHIDLMLNKLESHYSEITKESVQKQSDSSLKSNNTKCKKPTISEINSIATLIKTDTVVFADPEKPPYSLLALPILWPSVSWDISYHVHSSLINNTKISKTIKFFNNVCCKDNSNSVKVFVIWQHIIPSPKTVRAPTDTLTGEISLLRLFNHYLVTEKPVAADDQTKSDNVLDLINEIGCSTDDRTSELHHLINFSSTNLDIENVVIWSILYNNDKNTPKIEKWLNQFTKLIIPNQN
jgi:hypothetical protein